MRRSGEWIDGFLFALAVAVLVWNLLLVLR